MEFPQISTKYQHVTDFVNQLAPIVCNEWLRRRANGDKTISPAVVIAQAGLESGWNLEAKTLFGIKGEGETLDTSEFINGEYVNIQDSFKSFPTLTAATQGYFDLMQSNNYDDATSAATVEGEIYGLTNAVNGTDRDANGNWVGYNYATSPDYYNNVLSIVNNFGLGVYNDYVWSVVNGTDEPENSDDETSTEATKSVDEIADEIYNGDWGNYPERKNKLEAAGYNYDECQARMMEKYYPDLQPNDDYTPDEPSEDNSSSGLEVDMDVRFTGSCDVNGVPLKYTDRIYQVQELDDDTVVLSIYGETYARVNRSEVEPV